MEITINLSSVAWFIIFCLAVAISIFLIILIKNLIRVVASVQKVMDNSAQNIEQTIAVLPQTLKSVDDVAVSAKTTLDKATSLVTNVEEGVSETIDSFSFNAENIVNIINIASSVIKSIMSAFSREK